LREPLRNEEGGGYTKRFDRVGARADDGVASLIAEVRRLIRSARSAAATTVNTLQVLTNFEIGRRIVEHEQGGSKRAGYGDLVLRTLAESLTEEFGQGFSKRNLGLCASVLP